MTEPRPAPVGAIGTSVPWPRPGDVTLAAGLTLCVSDAGGNLDPSSLGLVVRDVRHLSRWSLSLDGRTLQSAVATADGWGRAEFRDPERGLVRRRRLVPGGFDERIELRGQGRVEVAVGCDFADVFEIRDGAKADSPGPIATWSAATRVLRLDAGERATTVEASVAPTQVADARLSWDGTGDVARPWVLDIAVRAMPAPPPAVTQAGWSGSVTSEPPGLADACRRSRRDLAALTIQAGAAGDARTLAAGVPWYLALFGRDSLIASQQALAFDADLLIGTLRALADLQGTRRDPGNDEEPGKILHEQRFTPRPWLGSSPSGAYFGTIDATPLFLVMLGEAMRWGAPRDVLRDLLPAASRALDWMRRFGDRDGDGLIEYAPGGERSLRNQGWKDAPDAIRYPDGRLVEGPIALIEVQGYAERARRELAAVLAWLGDDGDAAALVAEADELRTLIHERFWVPATSDRPGYFALALDGAKARVDTIASNMAHLLWCGTATPAQAADVAAHLTHPRLASGWGLRTLSAEAAGFDPASYHCGSVWPHDTLMACEGLRRYGLDAEAMDLAGALVDLLAATDGRPPELFGGHARDAGAPVALPVSCVPQAWAAGAAPGLVRLFLGLEPSVPQGRLTLRPRLPAQLRRLRVDGLRIAGGVLSVEVDGGGVRVLETPRGLTITVDSPDRGG